MAKGSAINSLVFDLGNVLIDFDHSIAARRISKFCDKDEGEIFRLFFDSGITALFEAGKISPGDFFLKVKEMLGLRLSFESFLPIWNEIFFISPKNRAVFSLINSLSPHYKIALLSNINMLHYAYLKKNFPVFSPFDQIFTSFELGAVKPQQEVYCKVLDQLKSEPTEVFYTDDRQELVESAKSLGIRAFLFQGVKQLKHDLASLNIKID